ncbi:hypothetical protein CO204_08205 [Streptococcus mutans]|uniref:Uncharacterized protein n=1 Tax=Streptococcus mutans SM6 TaxID=857119 RepID=A0A829BT00_STRMG|nr:hypothetical protein CO204_08205 [Streptococcus mutans]EMB66508.1 hypothetical protein SMU26_04921 [Streptococcus mutans 3SN1]EMC25100.1 hypothetical protein SMU82_02761 [Streptococcus mutans SM6]EMC49612.1 hypothetical protein SMU102_06404 [Streptococcus mutans S1B]NLQ34366.1 hypothetical protein [Streptococcus mutans]
MKFLTLFNMRKIILVGSFNGTAHFIILNYCWKAILYRYEYAYDNWLPRWFLKKTGINLLGMKLC